MCSGISWRLAVVLKLQHVYGLCPRNSSLERNILRERARAAREFANQSKERAAILFCTAEALLARFDALERRMLLRSFRTSASVSRHIEGIRPIQSKGRR